MARVVNGVLYCDLNEAKTAEEMQFDLEKKDGYAIVTKFPRTFIGGPKEAALIIESTAKAKRKN